MFRFSVRSSVAILLPAFALVLAACAGQTPGVETSTPPPPGNAPPPANMNVGDFVGRWGLAAYHRDADRARTEVAARGQCSQPYVITRGPGGGVMMHLADASQQFELRLKAGSGGKVYLGPEGPAADAKDREVVTFDGSLLILRWIDPEIAGRYGTMVYVRCDAAGTRPPAKKAVRKKTTAAPKAAPAGAPALAPEPPPPPPPAR